MPDLAHGYNINITSGTIIRFFVILIALVAAYFLSDVVLVVLAAVIIASSIEPVLRRLSHYKINRVVGAVLIYIFLAVVLAAIVVFFMPIVINDITSFISNAPKTISLGEIWTPLRDFGTGPGSLADHTISVSSFVNGLRSFFGAGNGTDIFQTANFIFGGFLSFVLIAVLSFYLSAQDDGVADFLRIVVPVKKQDYIIDLWRRSQRKIAIWLQGQIVLGVVVGLLVYLVLSVLGIPHALVLALLAAILEIIPVFGPIISSIPAILVAFTNSGAGTGFLLMGLYLVIYQFESQLFYPLVVKKIVGISPIVVILALVVGAKLAGVLGAVIAVPLSAAFMEYVHDVEKRKKSERDLPVLHV
jgi:predicted PurR-regulated permease PerM